MDLGQGGDMGCKILEVWENTVARIQTQRSWEHGGRGGGARLQERRVRNKERLRGRYAHVLFWSLCFWLCHPLCTGPPGSLTDICFSHFPSVTFSSLWKPTLCGSVNALSRITWQQPGGGLASFFQSFCSGEKNSLPGSCLETRRL